MRRAALLLFVLPPLLAALLLALQAPAASGAAVLIFWIFVSIPFGIVTVLDWFREATPASAAGRMAHNVFRVPVFLLGLVACLIGAAVLAWVAYAMLRKGHLHPDLRALFRASHGVFAMISVLAFGWYLINLSLRRRALRAWAGSTTYSAGRRSYPELPVGLRRELDRVAPSREPMFGLAYNPCEVTLNEGTVIDHVYVQDAQTYIRLWRIWPEDDPGKNAVDIGRVAHLRDSPTRLPARFADELYRAGESFMGGCAFTVVFADGTRQVYTTGDAVDFIPYPEGRSPSDIVRVLPHQGRGDRTALEGCDYRWCLYGTGESTKVVLR